MNWAFISIPKTGSNSIHRALGTNKKDNHKSIKLIECDYSFAFIRHPLDRLVSWYFGHQMTSPKLYGLPFIEWVARGCKHHWTKENLKTFGVNNPLNQYEFVEINRRVEVDFLGRFEHIQEDFDKVCKTLGVQAELPHLLKSEHGNWKKYFDKGLEEYALKMFNRDFKLWESLNFL